MSSELFQNKYRIPSVRATWHDYNGGAYFITVCCKNREHYFGEICRDVARHVFSGDETIMQLTEIGQYLQENLQNVAKHYPYAEIPLFVVMPNHWHAIVFIDSDKIHVKIHEDVARHVSTGDVAIDCEDVARHVSTGDVAIDCRDVARHVSTGDVAIDCRDVARHVSTWDVAIDCRDVARHVSTGRMRNIRNQQGFLSVVIGGIKSAVTKYANEKNIEFAWQPRFDDHIIRNQNAMNKIADYIENNVLRWDMDCFNILDNITE